jgi:two-component system, OmpR family, sensor kinase
VRAAWRGLGRRGRRVIAIAAIVLAAVAALFLATLDQLSDESGRVGRDDAQAEVVVTFAVAGGFIVAAALLAGYWVGEAFSRQRRFVSDASHELRTPLTAIRGQLEVLARQPDPEAAEVRRVEGVVGAELGRIERLVDELLALARLDEEAPLRRRRLELTPFLRGFAESAAAAGVVPGDSPAGMLSADPDRLTQVLRNLVANARRAAGPGGRVEISAEAQRGGRLAILVDDDGPGIPPAERERVFDRFQRSGAARDRDSGGSGLGLAIARSIVELHGGRIRVEDSPLGGARLRVELGGFAPLKADEKPLI